MKILITGATGLIGSELVKQCLIQGIEINYLTTNKSNLNSISSCRGYYWNPIKNDIDEKVFDGVSAIINLAGASVASPWSASHKRKILSSRVLSIQLIMSSLERINHRVDHFICASGISIYPSSPTIQYSENESNHDHSFLAEVVSEWEKSADAVKSLGIKVAKVRTGIVLSRNGGALVQLMKPIKLGLGAVIGAGNQHQSWIHIEDIAGIYLHILNKKLEGVYNGVSPNPSTNKDLTLAIASSLNRSIWLPNIHEKIIKLMLGERSALALDGQWVSSNKIEMNGYNFKYKFLDEALSDLI